MSKSARRRQRASQRAVRGPSRLLPPVRRPPGRHAMRYLHKTAPSTRPSERGRAARRALAPVPTGLYDQYAAAPILFLWVTDLWYARGLLPAEAPGEAPHAERGACSTPAALGAATI